ncbi:MAG: hypothetical protein MK135_12870 [Polyangiaceae bacterium]|nr:hypothetical protein [Polyangiaceae bacterium]
MKTLISLVVFCSALGIGFGAGRFTAGAQEEPAALDYEKLAATCLAKRENDRRQDTSASYRASRYQQKQSPEPAANEAVEELSPQTEAAPPTIYGDALMKLVEQAIRRNQWAPTAGGYAQDMATRANPLEVKTFRQAFMAALRDGQFIVTPGAWTPN